MKFPRLAYFNRHTKVFTELPQPYVVDGEARTIFNTDQTAVTMQVKTQGQGFTLCNQNIQAVDALSPNIAISEEDLRLFDQSNIFPFLNNGKLGKYGAHEL